MTLTILITIIFFYLSIHKFAKPGRNTLGQYTKKNKVEVKTKRIIKVFEGNNYIGYFEV